jgi:LysW-gamma-L-alpha-aminoadipyl-6-phosphate/LysW-L-glutamyl-5-phosphate reductase
MPTTAATSLQPTLRVCVLGASGFGGGELLRLLAAHPAVAEVTAIAHKNAKAKIAKLHPHLAAAYPGEFFDMDALRNQSFDVIFAALPHGAFAAAWSELKPLIGDALVIDLSGDFRLKSEADFQAAYGQVHPCAAELDQFHYGLSEFTGDRLFGVKRISNPGCFASAIELALLPLTKLEQASELHCHISAVTGSSGSGAALSEGTHHPTRAHDFRAYKVFQHQHEFEIRQLLKTAAADAKHIPSFSLIPHSAPMVRGIYVSAQVSLPHSLQSFDWHGLYEDYYQAQPMVWVQNEIPRTAAVVGSSYTQIMVQQRGEQLAVLATLDNLLKGMAGQAVQNMNLALGFAQQTGLEASALFP